MTTRWESIKQITLLPMVLVLAVAVACGNEAGSGGTDRLEISLDELNGSGQSGTDTLTSNGGATKVVLSLSEGTTKSEKVHIHNGQCGPNLAGLPHGLTDFADGNSVTTLEAVSLESLLTGGIAVNAHKAGDPKVYTACGNIPAS
jgi:hypothetical protein